MTRRRNPVASALTVLVRRWSVPRPIAKESLLQRSSFATQNLFSNPRFKWPPMGFRNTDCEGTCHKTSERRKAEYLVGGLTQHGAVWSNKTNMGAISGMN